MDEPINDASEEALPVETTDESSEAPPWGEDFDPQRAWNTIQNLRSESKEFKSEAQRARELQQQWDDEDAHFEFLRNRGYQFDDDEDDLDLYEDEGPNPELQKYDERIARIEAAEAERAFNADLSDLAKEAGVELTQRDRRMIAADTAELGNNDGALKKAFKAWNEEREEYEKQVLERYRESKKAPHVSKVGKQATDVPDLDSMSRSDRVKWMTERYMDGQQQ